MVGLLLPVAPAGGPGGGPRLVGRGQQLFELPELVFLKILVILDLAEGRRAEDEGGQHGGQHRRGAADPGSGAHRQRLARSGALGRRSGPSGWERAFDLAGQDRPSQASIDRQLPGGRLAQRKS